ncbi:MAG: hypothetical protein DMG40_08340 [Acidobacteria bacterium]|nr:MAG: hypothetical protein DMG40_08340 [Acidobacteriota bacterium]
MKKIAMILFALSVTLAPAAISQTIQEEAIDSSSRSPESSPSPTFFPRHWIRGYTDFAVAPSHNEPDLGRCMYPQPASAGGSASQCTAYARYLFSGYVEIQPLGRTAARHLFLFFEPRFSFGRNIPQLSYDESMEPIAYDRAIGAGYQLPRNFELRLTQHQVDYLGRYSRLLGPADLRTTGPYGLYTTVSVRWTFGGYGRNGSPAY